jgi:hypothetical protein
MVAPRASSPQFPLRFPSLTVLLAICAVSSALIAPASAHPGKWSPDTTLNGIAVHMALMPADNTPYHSRVLWWDELGNQAFFGGQWGWNPVTSDCSSYPSAGFKSIAPPNNIFCSGFTHLADGRLFVMGGSETGTENGIRECSIFSATDSSAGSWTSTDAMADRRWYGTAITLASGKILGLSGSKYVPIDVFSGLTNGAATPTDSSLMRFGTAEQGNWESAVTPQGPSWPGPRFASAGVTCGWWGNRMLFGGFKWNGAANYLTDEVWFASRNANPTGTDYSYTWAQPSISTTSNPVARAYHVAIVQLDSMLVSFGGLGQFGPKEDVWRLRPDRSQGHEGQWKWEPITIGSGPAPGARFGHRAIYDADLNRMLVFGGVNDTTSGPWDTRVWALALPSPGSTGATWSVVTVVDSSVHPSARYDHSMEYENIPFNYTVSGTAYDSVKSAVLFGGRGVSGARYNDVWHLLLLSDGTVRWKLDTVTGAGPAPRSAHSGLFQNGTRRLFVFGGKLSTGAESDSVWMTDMSGLESPYVWHALARRGSSAAWHSALWNDNAFNRVPEIYDGAASSGSQWSHATGANTALLQSWYPQAFMAPNGKVFVSGPADASYYFDLSNGQWSQYPSSSTSGFIGGGAVMYTTCKVMKCGSRDIESWGHAAVATTKTIDLTSGSSTWQSAGDMVYGRVNMNLTVLPTGKVLATGGTLTIDNDANSGPVKQPEIWDPDAGAWSATSLDSSTVRRGYHSTAILLPDGRILCAGGNPGTPKIDDPYKLDLYCPPYLFNSSGALATRPVILDAAPTVNWGETFSVCVPDTFYVRRACLIRASSTTHGFNMEQRYVPLTFSQSYGAHNGGRLSMTAPAGPDSAPPGYYMLFITGSADGADVPAIARWVRLGLGSGRDINDGYAPAADSTTAYFAVDMISSTSCYLDIIAPADDGRIGASGRAREYDLRSSSSAITTDAAYASASLVAGEPAPGDPGTLDLTAVKGLQSCHTYHFAMRSRDDNCNLSGLSNDLQVNTLGCGGGGGAAAEETIGGEPGAGTGSSTALASSYSTAASNAGARRPGAMSLSSTGGVVVVESRRGTDGAWQVVANQLAADESLGLGGESGIFIQQRHPNGAWVTLQHLSPGNDESEFDLCALRDGRRVVMAGNYQLKQVAGAIHGGDSDYSLVGATQGSAGDVSADLAAAAGSVSIPNGDSLSLTYRPTTSILAEAGSWFASVARVGGASFAAHQPFIEPAVPLRFALRQNQPNPFHAVTTIRFDLPVGGIVQLDVFDATGRKVRTLASHYFPPGYQSVTWSPKSEGSGMGPGVYFYRLQAGPFRAKRKAVLLP